MGNAEKKLIPFEDDFRPRPGRVRELFPSKFRSYLRLDGNWSFATDPPDKGIAEKWFLPSRPFKRKLKVPGNWNAQGVGGKGRGFLNHPGLGYTNVGPVLKGSYYGPAWYRREFCIPAGWKQRRIFLTLGGVHPNLCLWVNRVPVAARATGGTALRFDVTACIRPGSRNSVTVRIDNRPDRTLIASHINHFSLWGGIYHSVELTATSDLYVDRVKAVPDVAKKTVRLSVRLNNTGGRRRKVAIHALVAGSDDKSVYSRTIEVSVPRNAAIERRIAVEMERVRPWSPEHPHLYRFEVSLIESDRVIDSYADRFGMRTIATKGNKILLNGDPLYIRGTTSCWHLCRSITPPADLGYWKARLAKMKEYGFNHVRTSWILPEEYLHAADEAGIFVQYQMGYVHPRARCLHERYLARQITEVVETSFNHPSLLTYAVSNEWFKGSPLITRMYRLCKKLDPTRLAMDTDGIPDHVPHRSTYDVRLHFPHPFHLWPRYMEATLKTFPYFDRVPIVLHEHLNVPSLPVLTARLYTGAMSPPDPLVTFGRWLKKNRLFSAYAKYLSASLAHQARYIKEGSEITLRNGKLSGYSQCGWNDIDPLGVYWAILDSFGRRKGISPEQSRVYNSEQVLLSHLPGPKGRRLSHNVIVRTPPAAWQRWQYEKERDSSALPAYTYYAGDTVPVELYFRHHEENLPRRANVRWQLKRGGRRIRGGRLRSVTLRRGALTHLGDLTLPLPDANRPVRWTIEARMAASKVANSWDLWSFPYIEVLLRGTRLLYVDDAVRPRFKHVFPRQAVTRDLSKAGAALVGTLEEACTTLSHRVPTILLELDAFPHVTTGFDPGWFTPGNLNQGAVIEKHPALRTFPHEGQASWPFRYMLERALRLDHPSARPFTPVISGIVNPQNPKLAGHLCETDVGGTVFLVTGMNLLQNRPETRYLLDCLVRYAHKNESSSPGKWALNKLVNYSLVCGTR